MSKRNYIIGGGISGASFSYFARKCDNFIFEKEINTNGRIKSYPIKNNSIEIGAQFFCKEDKNIYDLIKEIRFDNNLQRINLQNFTVINKDRMISLEDKNSDEFSNCEKEEFIKFYTYLEEDLIEILKNPSKELFSINFDRWYKKNIGKNSDWLIKGLIRAITFSEPKYVSSIYGLLVCSTFFEPCYTINGGMDLINKKLLSISNPKIMTRNEITSLKLKNNKIELLELNHKRKMKIEKKDSVISTIPSKELAKLLPDSILKKQLDKIEYNGCGVILIKTKKQMLNYNSGLLFTKNYGISIIIDEGKYIGFKSRKGYIVILVPYQKEEKQIFEKALEEVKSLIPELEKNIVTIEYYNWDYGLPIANTEFFNLQSKIFENKLENLHICGDYMGMPSLDTCIESTKLAAKKIIC